MTMPSKYSPIELSNKDFIAGVFHDLPLGAHVYGCAFNGPPEDANPGVWMGSPLTARTINGKNNYTRGDYNAFYVVSSFFPDAEGRVRRRKAQFAAAHTICIDDLGDGMSAKIPWSSVKLPPSYVIETSPSNCQAGYILNRSQPDADKYNRVVDALIFQGLSAENDPGMKSISRYMRLPKGRNHKKKYGEPWTHIVRHWEPELKYSLENIIAPYGLKLAPPQPVYKKSGGVKIDIADDPYVKILSDLGLVLNATPRSGGEFDMLDIMCVWADTHTDRIDEGTVYIIGSGTTVCHHGHCHHKRNKDFKQTLHDVHGVDVDALDEQLKNLTMAKKHRQVEDYLKLLKARKNNG
jgi:hypothetical protein